MLGFNTYFYKIDVRVCSNINRICFFWDLNSWNYIVFDIYLINTHKIFLSVVMLASDKWSPPPTHTHTLTTVTWWWDLSSDQTSTSWALTPLGYNLQHILDSNTLHSLFKLWSNEKKFWGGAIHLYCLTDKSYLCLMHKQKLGHTKLDIDFSLFWALTQNNYILPNIKNWVYQKYG